MTEAQVLAITSAVDFTDVYVGIGAIAATMAALFVGIRGAGILLGMIRGRNT